MHDAVFSILAVDVGETIGRLSSEMMDRRTCDAKMNRGRIVRENKKTKRNRRVEEKRIDIITWR
jgi:hypothetical protein